MTPLSELDFCLHPIPHLGACSEATCAVELTFLPREAVRKVSVLFHI